MLTNALILIIVLIISSLLSLLPEVTDMPTGFNNAWNWITEFIGNIIYVIPSGETLLTIFGLVITIEFAIFIWKNINWVINKIRGSGS